ncbi:hypothetical protein ACHAQA_006341 [Verticillium albo-atrum]
MALWPNPRTPPALPPRSPKRPEYQNTGLPSPPLLPPRPVSYVPYRPAGAVPEQWDTSPLQWTHGDQRRQSVPSSGVNGVSRSLRRKPVGDPVRPSLPPRPYTSSPVAKEIPRPVSYVSPVSEFASPTCYAPPSPPAETPVRTALGAPSPRWSWAPSELDAAESVPPPPYERDELVDDIDEMLSELEVSSAGWDDSELSIDGDPTSVLAATYPELIVSPIEIPPLSPPAVPPKLPLFAPAAPCDGIEKGTAACLAAPEAYAFPATWYRHPDMPGVWICAGCFARCLGGTKFDPQFEGRAYDDGSPRTCRFSTPRVVDVLLPHALATGFLQPLIEHLNEVSAEAP